MMPFVRQLLGRRPFPQHFSGLAIEAQHVEPIQRVGELDAELPLRLIFGPRGGFDNGSGVDRRGDEHAVIPDDGRGFTLAGHLRFPLHIARIVPFHRRIAERCHAVGVRPAPLRPVL